MLTYAFLFVAAAASGIIPVNAAVGVSGSYVYDGEMEPVSGALTADTGGRTTCYVPAWSFDTEIWEFATGYTGLTESSLGRNLFRRTAGDERRCRLSFNGRRQEV